MNACTNLVALLERHRAGDDFPLLGFVAGVRIGELITDVELVGDDRERRLRIRAAA